MMQKHTLETQNIVAGYDGKVIVDGINLSIPDGKITVIIGANACGKSTLLKTIARLIKPISGEIMFDGKCIHQIQPKHLARELGLLTQSPVVPEGITVADLVARGRFPHQSFLKGMTKRDYEVVEEALECMGISELSDRNVDELSGGQRQRVWIAMALAQETDVLLLDEPTTYLDVTHQIEILDLLMDLNRMKGKTIVMVLHDINLSARYADHIFALKKGAVVAEGKPSEILSCALIKSVFDLDCTVLNDPISDTPMIVPIGRHHKN
jgi:iron complex transport system ATP-binding protein